MKIENRNIIGLRNDVLRPRNLVQNAVESFIQKNPKSSKGEMILSFIRMEEKHFLSVKDRYENAKVKDKLKALNPSRYTHINEDSIIHYEKCFDLPDSYKDAIYEGYSDDICVFPMSYTHELIFEEVLIFENSENILLLNHLRTPECIGLSFPDWYEDNYKFNIYTKQKLEKTFLKDYTLKFSGYIIGSQASNDPRLSVIAKDSGRYTSEAEVVELACKGRPILTNTEFGHIKELIESSDMTSVIHGLNILCSYDYTKHSFVLWNLLSRLKDKNIDISLLSKECKYMIHSWVNPYKDTFEISEYDMPLVEGVLKNILLKKDIYKKLSDSGLDVDIVIKRKA